MNNITIPFVPLQLSKEAHYYAQKFAAEQTTPEKIKRVYLNTLAVCAVHSYLKWMEFETDLSQSDSWDSLARRFNDVADLVLPGLGKLECRPVGKGETAISLPPEVTEDRIGCILVQFEEELDKVKLLGFIWGVANSLPEVIEVSKLESCEYFVEYLEEIASFHYRATPSTHPEIKVNVVENLRQWLENIFGGGWQPLTAYRGLSSAYSGSDKSVSRAKEFDFGMQVAGESIQIVVTLTPRDNGEVDVTLRVLPSRNSFFLPPGLELKLQDEDGEISTVMNKSESDCLEMELERMTPGIQFSVTLTLRDVSFTEKFAI